MRMRKAKLTVAAAPSLASWLGRGISFWLLWVGGCSMGSVLGRALQCRGTCSGGDTGQAVRGGTGSCPGFPKAALGRRGELGEWG